MKKLNGKIMVVVFAAGAMLLFGSGCESMQLRSSSNDKQLKQDIASARREANYCLKQVRGLNNRNRLLQQDYSTLAGRFADLEQQLKQLKSNNAELSRKISELNRVLEQEAKNRDASIKNMAKNIAKQTSAAINSSRQATRTATKNNTGPVGSGDFYKYKVQRGATLSAIAKAYKVKVADIRRVNRLKNDNIRTGQTLYIPKK
ncbi:MAG: LysM peptidoglycan-binding domain-containing protein [Victivallaceae bacterium]|nr:LysM peptidoglycan-binding domain-containing protein [Victivallaceae bacterium]